MTHDEAIQTLKILKEDYWDDDGYGHESKLYDDTELALDMAIKALEDSRWIPVTERLPEEEGYYLVTVFDDWRHISEICIEYWLGKRQDWSTALEVIAWMPSLPKPYEGSEEE